LKKKRKVLDILGNQFNFIQMNQKTEDFELIDKDHPWGVIRFIHSDDKQHEFYSVINLLTGCRMSAFDNCAPSVDDTMKWVKSVFRDIKAKAKVIEYKGTKHFEK
jgi:hypothetical protein